MSALAGQFYRNGQPVQPACLKLMLHALAHRGPDRSRQWVRGALGLGHAMLYTTPESFHEHLPRTSRADTLAITADARLDNRATLLATFGWAYRPAGDIPDSELILAAYERWGSACPAYLLGDFAFVIWDARSQSLFCARDPLGIKPFYYHLSPQLFAFGSEIKALLQLDEVPQTLDERRVANYLVGNCDDLAATFYRAVRRLPPGTWLQVRADDTHLATYWQPDATNELRLGTDAAYAEAFRELLLTAVHCRVRSAFPVGAMLSGGLDSSSVVCAARHTADATPRLHTFSGTFPSLALTDPRSDERRYVAAVLAQGGVVGHEVAVDQCSPLAGTAWHSDEPIIAPNMYLDLAICQAARSSGTRVLLSGHDGDTVVGYGLEYLANLARTGQWGTLYHEAGALAAGIGSRRHSIIWHLGVQPLLPAWGGTPPASFAISGLINPAFAAAVGLQPAARRKAASVRAEHCAAITAGLLVLGSETFDLVTGAHQLEARHPFLDRRLVEFCLALPAAQRLKQGWTRSILRRAMAGLLPPEVQWRRGKSNISAGIKHNLLTRDRPLIEQYLYERSAVLAERVDIAGLRASYQRYAADPNTCEQEALHLFLAVNLAIWLEKTGVAVV